MTTATDIIQITQQLLDAIDGCNWADYQELCDSSLTAFEPEAVGHLVEGMAFHKFYLAPGPDGLARQSTISSPHVRLMTTVAVISYVRLTQVSSEDGSSTTLASEETRVWEQQDGCWQHVHFHRSPAS
tara:strand:- start:761 stop:1144 length:384 start_codon:yes stop_codon:yes gene_type:complete